VAELFIYNFQTISCFVNLAITLVDIAIAVAITVAVITIAVITTVVAITLAAITIVAITLAAITIVVHREK
jgi:hypothetical protein